MVTAEACQVKLRHVYGRNTTVFRQATELNILPTKWSVPIILIQGNSRRLSLKVGLNQRTSWSERVPGPRMISLTGEADFCASAFSYVLRTKHIVFSNFHSLEALEACLEACPEVFCSNSHGLATLELETCIEACLQLYFIF